MKGWYIVDEIAAVERRFRIVENDIEVVIESCAKDNNEYEWLRCKLGQTRNGYMTPFEQGL